MSSKKIAILLSAALLFGTSELVAQDKKKTEKKKSSWTLVGVHKDQSFKIKSVFSVVEGSSEFVIMGNQASPVIGFLKPGEVHIWLVIDKAINQSKVKIKSFRKAKALASFVNPDERKAAGFPADKVLDYGYALCFHNDTKAIKRYTINQPNSPNYSALSGTVKVSKHKAGQFLRASISILFAKTQLAGTISLQGQTKDNQWEQSKQTIQAYKGKKRLRFKAARFSGEDCSDFIILSTISKPELARLAPGETQVMIFIERVASPKSILKLKKITTKSELLTYVDISTRREKGLSKTKAFGHIYAVQFTNTTDKARKIKLDGPEVTLGTANSGLIELEIYQVNKFVKAKFTLHFKDLCLFGQVEIPNLRKR